MAAETEVQAAGPGGREPNHALRLAVSGVILAVAADLLIWFVWGPHLPPGGQATQADGQRFDIKVMAVMAAPVMVFVILYFAYSLVVWRHKEADTEDGPPIHGNTRVQTTWITVTSVNVLSLFGYGTYEL